MLMIASLVKSGMWLEWLVSLCQREDMSAGRALDSQVPARALLKARSFLPPQAYRSRMIN